MISEALQRCSNSRSSSIGSCSAEVAEIVQTSVAVVETVIASVPFLKDLGPSCPKKCFWKRSGKTLFEGFGPLEAQKVFQQALEDNGAQTRVWEGPF